MLDFKSAVAFGGWADQGPRILPKQWYTQYMYLWCFFNDLFIDFVVVFPQFGTLKEIREGCNSAIL